MSSRKLLLPLLTVIASVPALGADLILNNQTVTLGGVQTYGVVSLTNGSRVIVPAYNGTSGTGNLVLKANSITIDASSRIIAKGAGYRARLCSDGQGPAFAPAAGGRGGCSVFDGAGGGGHRGTGGRGTRDCAPNCTYPASFEEDCAGSVNGSGTACVSTAECRNNDGLPSTAGAAFSHDPYSITFGAAGGDKGCRDGDGFLPAVIAGGNGGGRIVLFAANAAQTGQLILNGEVNADGNRGCAYMNDPGGGGAGGSILLIADTVTVGSTARITASGGRGGDTQPKCLSCTGNADCSSGQTCIAGRCSPCNCTPCTSNAQCNLALGQTCKNLGGSVGNVCADASNQCTPLPSSVNESECAGTQNAGACDDGGGGGGGGEIRIRSRVATLNPLATIHALGGLGPLCLGMNQSAGTSGLLELDGAYTGEICDGFDNDFNGSVDDGLPQLTCPTASIPSCVGGVPQQCPADVPACRGPVTDTRPRFLILVDTSDDMLQDVNGVPTFGDGTLGHVGVDTNSDVDTTDGNNSRLYLVKEALKAVFNAAPQSDFALGRLHQDVALARSCKTASWCECSQSCSSYDEPRNNVAPASSCNLEALFPVNSPAVQVFPSALDAPLKIGWAQQADCTNYAGSCGAAMRGADWLVGFGAQRTQHQMWLDGTESNFNSGDTVGDHCSGGDCELRASGPRPLAAALQSAQSFINPIASCDGAIPCRPYTVILVAAGVESCDGDPLAAVTALKTSIPGITIPTYVVGIGVRPGDVAQLDALAAAGGTMQGHYATDVAGLTAALDAIIASKTNAESCNGIDDDCDGATDEDFPDKGAVCDNGLLGACRATGARVCDSAGTATSCELTTSPGTASPESCNGVDDDCDGATDEDFPTLDAGCDNGLLGVCHAVGVTVCDGAGTRCEFAADAGEAAPESCNGLDDDCDGTSDEGEQLCDAGWVCASGACVELDAGVADAGEPDAGADAGTDDAGVDAGSEDAGAVDAGARDAGPVEELMADAGAPDAGTGSGQAVGCGCAALETGALSWLLPLALAIVARRRRLAKPAR